MSDNHVTHLLVGKYGNPTIECRTRNARFAVPFTEYDYEVKHGEHLTGLGCKRCQAAYERRLAAVRARKAAEKAAVAGGAA